MLTAEEFKTHWLTKTDVNLVCYTEKELDNAILKPVTKSFLTESGFPEICAPYLSFDEKLYSDSLLSLKNYNNLENDDFSNFYVLGTETNNGDMICIDSSNDDKIFIVSNDHIHNIDQKTNLEYQEGFIPTMFINSSVLKLAQSIFAFGEFVNNIRKANNGIIFFECDISKDQAAQLEKSLREVDDICTEKNSFWWFELENLNIS